MHWGGEEFMILLPHTKIKNAASLAERIRNKIENKYSYLGTLHIHLILLINTKKYNEKQVSRLPKIRFFVESSEKISAYAS